MYYARSLYVLCMYMLYCTCKLNIGNKKKTSLKMNALFVFSTAKSLDCNKWSNTMK